MTDRVLPDGGRRRHVLIVAPQPIYEDRGTPIAVRELAAALVCLGHRVDLATFPVGKPLDVPGVRVIRTRKLPGILRVPIGFSIRKLVLDVFLFAKCFSLLRGSRYDWIHGVEEGGFLASLLGNWFGLPVVYDMQSSLPDQLSRHWLFGRRAIQRVLRVCEAWLLDRADLVVCSAGLAEQVHRIAPRTPVREWIYPASLPSPQMAAVSRLRKQLKLAEQERVVLYAGTFERYQGLTEVIEAIPAVSARVPGTVFVLVGAEPRSAARIRRQAKRMGLNGNLRVVDRQPREQLAAYYMLADVLLAPRASGRNLPLKLFHYMSAGRPVVATGVCNWPNSLPPVPVLVTRHTSADIAVAISRVLGDSVLASELSTRALLYATENLDTSRFVEAVQEVSLATTYGRRDAERFIPEGAAEGGVKG